MKQVNHISCVFKFSRSWGPKCIILSVPVIKYRSFIFLSWRQTLADKPLNFISLVEQKTYDWVLILAGTNDLLMGDSSSEKIADTIVIMHEVAHARGAKSLVITIPEIFCERKDCPDVESRRQEINKRLRMYASKAGSKAFLSDLALKISLHQLSLEDRKEFWEPAGVHLKRKGYDKMAEIIFQDLMESIESPFL